MSSLQKEDLSDGEASESLSSVPDSEAGVSEPPVTSAPAPDTRDRAEAPPPPRSVPASGGLSPQPPVMARVKAPRGQGLTPPGLTGSKPLTSLANLSPTPKSMLTGLL